MATQHREFESEEESVNVTIEVGDDVDLVTVDSPLRGQIEVIVEDDIAKITEPIPEWARKPLSQVGVQGFEYIE